jgi:hypothetical protein
METWRNKKRKPRPDLSERNRQNATHGMSSSRTFKIWSNMKERCADKQDVNYGGRGITVDPIWEKSFMAFLSDMGEAPAGMQIDRIDNNGNYEKSNCRWTTALVNANNKRTCVYVTYNNKTQTIADWARETGIERKTLEYRFRAGWSAERALTTPSLIKRK